MNYRSVYLRWDDNAGNNDGFFIERSLNESEGFEEIANIGDEQYYLDEGLIDETTFYYRVAAYNIFGNSGYSNVASAKTPAGPPREPSNLRAVTITYRAVTLNWDDQSNDELGFQINREDRGIWRGDHFTVGPNLTVFSDTTVKMNSTHRYRIRAFNDAEPSYSAYVYSEEITTPNGPPDAPLEFTAETISTHGILLTWRPGRSGNQESYILERRTEQDGWQQVDELDRTAISYEDHGLDENTLYTYRIHALNEIGPSEYSNEASAQTWSIIVLDDGFEEYITGTEPPDPWAVYSDGESYIRVTENDQHTGVKSLGLVDSNPIVDDSAYATLAIEFRPIRKGSVTVWFKPSTIGYLDILSGDLQNNLSGYEIQFLGDGYIHMSDLGFLYNTNVLYPVNEWFEFNIEFDVSTRSYSLYVNGNLLNTYLLINENLASFDIFLIRTWTNTTMDLLNIDDFIIIDTSDEEGGLRDKTLSRPETDGIKIDKTFKVFGEMH